MKKPVVLLSILTLSLTLLPAKGFSVVNEEYDWLMDIGDCRTYLLTDFYNRTAEGNNTHLSSTINAINGTQHPVTFEIGTEIQLTLTSYVNRSDLNRIEPVGTIIANNTEYTDYWIATISPLFFMVKTIDNATHWEQLSGYQVKGEIVSVSYGYSTGELMYHQGYLEFNYHSGWVEYLYHTHFGSTTKIYQFEIIRIEPIYPSTSASTSFTSLTELSSTVGDTPGSESTDEKTPLDIVHWIMWFSVVTLVLKGKHTNRKKRIQSLLA